MDKIIYSRWTSFVGMLFCFGLLAFAAYLQVYLKLMPCPLCVLQRIVLLFMGFVFLVGALYTPHERLGKRFHSGLLLLFSLLGISVAGRHVWLTLQPPSAVPSCSPTLEYMLQNMKLSETLKVMFMGSGDCAKVTFRLLTLSIPEWTLIVFIVLFVFGWVRYMLAKDDRDK
jgi:disulfide bond formation protein DsbB